MINTRHDAPTGGIILLNVKLSNTDEPLAKDLKQSNMKHIDI